MMRIAVDSWAVKPRFRHSGIAEYTLRLLDTLAVLVAGSADHLCTYTGERENAGLDCSGTSGYSCTRTAAYDQDIPWRLWGFLSAAKQARVDVAFAPHSHVVPLARSVPVVATIHDLTPVRTPWQMSRKLTAVNRAFLQAAARYSTKIITVSEHSKRDISEKYGVDPAKIHVTYLGINRAVYNGEQPDEATLATLKARLGLHRPYLFHHGAVQPRKNLKNFIRAHRLLLDRDSSAEYDLVLAGPRGWLCEDIFQLAEELASPRGRAHLVGALEERELGLLLKGAALCAYPSFYEGFCLPMVEAMASGVPVIASSSSCLPEISANVLRYFDPASHEEFAEVLANVLGSRSEQERLRQAGMERARCFTWEQTAARTLTVLRSACAAAPAA